MELETPMKFTLETLIEFAKIKNISYKIYAYPYYNKTYNQEYIGGLIFAMKNIYNKKGACESSWIRFYSINRNELANDEYMYYYDRVSDITGRGIKYKKEEIKVYNYIKNTLISHSIL